ncbi:MAG: 2-dehydro-3-deoxyphosphooctonate aldolase (KDO 8-P synthase) [Myxococcota bacterium]|jgi:2-dehydro-3-deoxyphosphooctonate aldolase (KDO 8-P synthase)
MSLTPTLLKLDSERPVLLAGPCAIEGPQTVDIACQIAEVIEGSGFNWVFKASFDKANRTASDSQRGVGLERGLDILAEIREKLQVPIVTDVHLPQHCAQVAAVADVLQIPAFLCRQTDLLCAAAETGRFVNIKKGQFLAPSAMQYAAGKVEACGNENIMLTERGTFFGYGGLVVDFASMPDFRYKDYPLILDATHSVQQPASEGSSTGGDWRRAPILLRAAAAAGYNGFFIETHPRPLESPSDGKNMIPLEHLRRVLDETLGFYNLAKSALQI